MTIQTESLSGIDIRAEIDRLRKDRNAVILAHYYQKPGNSGPGRFRRGQPRTVRKAAATDAEVIAFCGVKFMAETAKILARKRSWSCPIWMPVAALRIRARPKSSRPSARRTPIISR
jgi:quinolinate synthase